jgi:PPM family protein phosphatase
VVRAVELEHGARTDVGRVRDSNQDAFLAAPPVFVVADGMGGHQGGDVASRIVVEEFSRLAADGYDPRRAAQAVTATLGACRERIHAFAATQDADGVPARQHAGTTAVAAVLAEDDSGPCWLVANVGDSRAYRFADGELEQVSVDHSVVQELVDAGTITEAAATRHPERHLVTRALGDADDADPDFFRVGLDSAERLVLCTDGVSGMVAADDLADLLGRVADPGAAADQIVDAALDAGGQDNATVVVVDVRGAQP